MSQIANFFVDGGHGMFLVGHFLRYGDRLSFIKKNAVSTLLEYGDILVVGFDDSYVVISFF